MKKTGCGLEIFLTSGDRKERLKENENDIGLKKQSFLTKHLRAMKNSF